MRIKRPLNAADHTNILSPAKQWDSEGDTHNFID